MVTMSGCETKNENEKQAVDEIETGYFVTLKIGLPDAFKTSAELHERLNEGIMNAVLPFLSEGHDITLTHNVSVESLVPTRLV